MSMGLSSTVRILSSQLLSHRCRHTISKFSMLDRSVEESLEHILGKHSSHCSFFYAVSYHLLRTLTRAQQVSVPICMTATWSSCTFLVRFGDMSLAIDAACSTTNLGLKPMCDCEQSLKSISGAHTENSSYQRCHLSAGARDQSSCRSCSSVVGHTRWSSPRFQSCCLQTFPAWPLLSTAHHPVHHVIGLPHGPPSETQSHHSQDGFHRIAVASLSQLPCGSVSGRAGEPELDKAVVVRTKRSRKRVALSLHLTFHCFQLCSQTQKFSMDRFHGLRHQVDEIC